jgi:nitroreductase
VKPLAAAAEAVRLAPSGHNTQPWRLARTGARSLRIAWDPQRWLRAADPDGEVLACSLGCAVEAIASVAEIAHEKCPNAMRGSLPQHAGEIHVETLRPELDAALALLRERRTHRAPFAARPLDAEILARLVRAGNAAGAGVAVAAGSGALERIARLTARGARSCLADPAYLEELLAWIRLAPPFEDGFNPEALGLDRATRCLVARLQADAHLRRIAPHLGLAHYQAWQAARALRRSGALVAILVEADGWAAWVRAGRGMMALWLEAVRLRLGVQPVHFPLLLDDARREVMGILGAPPGWRAVTLLRVGWPEGPAPASGRLPLERMWLGEPEHAP